MREVTGLSASSWRSENLVQKVFPQAYLYVIAKPLLVFIFSPDS